MGIKPGVETVAVRVCRTIPNVRRSPELDQHRPCPRRSRHRRARTVDAAVVFAAAEGCVKIGGTPAHSVLLNRDAPRGPSSSSCW
jgi:hypothetical protein